LYQSQQPGVIEYLCNRLFSLSESALDSYLLQLVYLAVAKPGGPLERTLVELCSRFFKLAIKVVLNWRTWPAAHMHAIVHASWAADKLKPVPPWERGHVVHGCVRCNVEALQWR